MASRLLYSAYVAILITTGAVSFFILRDYDEQTIVGASSSILVTGTVDSQRGELVAQIESFSKKTGSTVAKPVPGLDAGEPTRSIYVTQGGATGRSWLKSGYPAFSRHLDSNVKPMIDAHTLDVRGVYLLIGSPEYTEDLSSILGATGATVQVNDERSLSRIAGYYLGSGPLLWMLLMGLTCTVMVVVSATILDSRRYAVQVLHGWSLPRILQRDLLDVARNVLPIIALLGVGAYLALHSYNGGNAFTSFLLLWGVIGACGFIILIGAQYVALATAGARSVLIALSGGVNTRPLYAALRILQIATIAVTIMIAGQFGSSLMIQSQLRTSSADWQKFGSLAIVELNGAQANDSKILSVVGQYGSDQLRRGKAIIASYADPKATLGEVPAAFLGWKVLVVNNAYMQRTSPTVATGASLDEEAVQVLVPSQFKGTPKQVQQVISPLLPLRGDTPPPPIVTGAMDAPDGVLTFGTVPPIGAIGGSSARDAKTILAVLPKNFSGVSPREIGAMMSNGSLLFLDQKTVLNDVRLDPELSRSILDVKPLRSIVAEKQSELSRQISPLTAGLTLALITLMGVSVGNTLVYVKSNARRIWVQTTNGWPAWLIHVKVLAVELTVASIAVLWQVTSQSRARAVMENPTSNAFDYFDASLSLSNWAVPGAAMVAVIIIGASSVSLEIVVRRFVRRKAAVT